jgi:hypothetical protein
VAVARTARGYLGSSSLSFEGISNLAILESLDRKEALASDMNLQNIEIATDCLESPPLPGT